MSQVLGKRQRGQTAQQKAYWANRRFNSLYPWSHSGAARVKRGSAVSLDSFGASWKTATKEQRMARKATGFTGRGKYGVRRSLGKFAKKAHIGKHLYDAAVGGALAGLTMGPEAVPAGVAAGYMGRGLYGRGLYGRGGYSNSNALIEGGRSQMQIGGGASDNQEVIIDHCEYIQDVFAPGTSNFSNQSISLNSGLQETFPWLAQIGANYEEYEFIQLIFHFRSTIDAGNVQSGATGTIILATNYNGDAVPFAGKEAMVSYHGAVSGRLTHDLDHGVECDPSKNAGSPIKFTRSHTPKDGQSLKDFDLGKFQFAVVNAPVEFQNEQIGELWATYKVKLGKPRLYASIYKSLPCERYIDSNQGAAIALNKAWSNTPGVNTGSLIGTNQQNVLGINLSPVSGLAASESALLLTFPDFMTGTFAVCWTVATADAGAGASIYPVGSPNFVITPLGNVSLLVKEGPILDTANPTNGIATTSKYQTDRYGVIAECVVSVQPATAGVNNTLKLNLINGTSGNNYIGSQLEIIPYNGSLSDKFEMSDGSTRNLSSNNAVF